MAADRQFPVGRRPAVEFLVEGAGEVIPVAETGLLCNFFDGAFTEMKLPGGLQQPFPPGELLRRRTDFGAEEAQETVAAQPGVAGKAGIVGIRIGPA